MIQYIQITKEEVNFMKKLMGFLKTNSLLMVSLVAMFVASSGASTASLFTLHQPECPKELLK